jgi:lysozyme
VLAIKGVMNRLLNDLIRDEGLRLQPYRDTVGKLTIGIGRNIDDNGITETEALLLAAHDIETVRRELRKECPWYTKAPEQVQRGLENMCYNMGWPRLSQFKLMLGALENKHYETAAIEALDSRWARQVGARATRIADLFRSAVVL